MYRTILVPLDGSPFGEHALPLAVSIARRSGAAIQLAHVHTPVITAEGDSLLLTDYSVDFKVRERERNYLDRIVKQVEAASTVPVTPVLLDGFVADVLTAAPRTLGVDLIVMTTHGRGPLSRFWLGSVADELVRRASVPLVLVRPGEGTLDMGQEKVLRHILIPLDGSALAEQILGQALALGIPMEAEYTLLRVIKPVTIAHPELSSSPVSFYGQELVGKLDKLQEEVSNEARNYLEEVATPLRAQSLVVRTCVVTRDQVASGILDEAAAHPVDLIALETHGRGGLARLFLGSVADKVLRGGSLPMLVLRPPVAERVVKTTPEGRKASKEIANCRSSSTGATREPTASQFHPGCWHGQ
jgi:nucleotide-binding universal stress UspA family protein